MLDNITSLDELEKQLKEIDDYMTTTCSEDGNEAVQRGNDVQVFIGRTSKMLADARYWQDIAMQENTMLCMEAYKSMPPMIRKRLIESMCVKENYVVKWCERLNAACTNHAEWLRTIISKAKAEYHQSKPFN